MADEIAAVVAAHTDQCETRTHWDGCHLDPKHPRCAVHWLAEQLADWKRLAVVLFDYRYAEDGERSDRMWAMYEVVSALHSPAYGHRDAAESGIKFTRQEQRRATTRLRRAWASKRLTTADRRAAGRLAAELGVTLPGPEPKETP